MSAARSDVYDAIDSEREYQDRRWNCETTPTCGRHSVTEFMVYMRDYLEEALHYVSRSADPQAEEFALNNIRKITALGVACMEQNGAPHRK